MGDCAASCSLNCTALKPDPRPVCPDRKNCLLRDHKLLRCRAKTTDSFVRAHWDPSAHLARLFSRSIHIGGTLSVRTVLDGGANGGYSTAFFAQMWPLARIVAVEPDADNYAVLRMNTRHFPGVEALQAGLWSTERTSLSVQEGTKMGGGAWNLVTHAAPPGSTDDRAVPSVAVPWLLQHLCLRDFDIVKLDVEGAETAIFSSSSTWLHHVKLLFIETHPRMMGRNSEKRVLDVMRAHNMSVVAAFPRRQWWERVFIACGQSYGHSCLAVCHDWHANSRQGSVACGDGSRCCTWHGQPNHVTPPQTISPS